VLLAETSQALFDLAAEESELVSGFNVEYRREGFALIVLAEYVTILFVRMLSVIDEYHKREMINFQIIGKYLMV
uniref:NADH-ubiquinone oxidoreductase chain 1 n=1 Tax=Glossina palpalis gambiensis TaxID=67801 RepID=A0A1B0AL27_9MUSC